MLNRAPLCGLSGILRARMESQGSKGRKQGAGQGRTTNWTGPGAKLYCL